MAFTFQINDEVQFNHDERLLNKAKQYKPVIHQDIVFPKSIVELVPDSQKLEGWGVQDTQDIEGLPNIKLKRNQKITLDFGSHQVGKFSIDINSVGSPMDAPLFIKLKFAEMPAELKHKSEDYHGWLSKSWIQEEYIHLDVLPTHLELSRRYSFRYVEITVIDTSPKWQAVLSNPQVESETSASNEQLSVPSIKDPEMKSIYQVGLKTLQDCMQDIFEDGPKRDRRLWIGDLRLQALANYATFKDVGLVKRCLYLFGAMTAKDGRIPANVFTQPQDIPDDTFLFDYSLFFISILDDFQRFKQDQELLSDLYPFAKKQMDVALEKVQLNGELILDDSYPVFIDWSNDFDKNTAGQAVLIYTLRQFIHLAKMMNDNVDGYSQKLHELISYSQFNLFDAEKGLFVSGPQHEVNIASQVWMVLARVLDDRQNKQVMIHTINELFPITGIATPYMYHHITQALFEAGMNDEAIKLMKDYWGQMISLGADTYWEAFEPAKPEYSPYGSPILNSYCHAWSCTPVYLIQKYLIGEE
ncbi:alpha-L-rhamnosidase-related protein [Lentilactobacillus buchneri]|nr:family 78 glycoside hydrolase catalytic domain [Lentilactobacillus buchneri]MCC6100678.1 family 78 glycoside hydrolase catalytic domain [Lactobacillus sp.]MCT2900623.1 alpha-rhamnosidase [Lentilactobacillus buchneri]MCT3542606.1 alpha-rhamnosidase [Lentilactobacillus buchneri]MCT3545677.1 alpha-rhamnosidase [Lentilactobacillus buchneri]MCT3552645.1 alpha-rhamnosidase [Lentilactobacillus buchneri]